MPRGRAANEVALDHEALDADPYLLNCLNGTLDLRTGALRAHDPNDLLTKLIGAAYHPTPPDDVRGEPRFGRFLTEIQPAAEMRAYLARLLAHALVGRLVEHILPLSWGDGASGKSTLLDVVLAALGDYRVRHLDGYLTGQNDQPQRWDVLHVLNPSAEPARPALDSA